MPYSYAKLSKNQMYSTVFNERSNGNFSLILSYFSKRHLQLFCGSSTGVLITKELLSKQTTNHELRSSRDSESYYTGPSIKKNKKQKLLMTEALVLLDQINGMNYLFILSRQNQLTIL